MLYTDAQLLEDSFLDFPSFTQAVNLRPNYKIIGNPTTFSCKTLPPRMIIFNALFLASTVGGVGERKRRRPRGNRVGGRSLLMVDLPSGTGHKLSI